MKILFMKKKKTCLTGYHIRFYFILFRGTKAELELELPMVQAVQV